MSSVGTIEHFEDRRLREYIQRRTEALRLKYKRIFKLEEGSRAFETLKLELYGLRETMRAASPGGTAEYTFLLGAIIRYVGKKYGLLTRAEQIDQLEIYMFVIEDIKAFEKSYLTTWYTKEEWRIVEEMRAIILSSYGRLHITRPT
jgi:hypothetical protein